MPTLPELHQKPFVKFWDSNGWDRRFVSIPKEESVLNGLMLLAASGAIIARRLSLAVLVSASIFIIAVGPTLASAALAETLVLCVSAVVALQGGYFTAIVLSDEPGSAVNA